MAEQTAERAATPRAPWPERRASMVESMSGPIRWVKAPADAETESVAVAVADAAAVVAAAMAPPRITSASRSR